MSRVVGPDRLWGGDGNDLLVGGPGLDVIVGGAGNDTIVSNGGGNVISGGDGIDTLDYSQATDPDGVGRDFVLDVENYVGSRFNDTIAGNDADNVIDGGDGADTMTGGNGPDIFRFSSQSPDVDTITDFNSGEGDRIDLSAIFAGARAAGEPSLDIFRAPAAASDQAVSSNNHWTVEADINGDGTADFLLEVHASQDQDLSTDDFIT